MPTLPPEHINYPTGGHADHIFANIWLGSRPPIGHYLADLGFTDLIGCEVDWRVDEVLYPKLALRYFPFQDSDAEGNHFFARSAAEALHRTGGPVLIHCWGGINRSGYAVALALIQGGFTARDAVLTIRSRRREYFQGQPALHNLAFLTALGVPDLAVPGIGGLPGGMHDLEARNITVKPPWCWLPRQWLANMVARELLGPEGPWPGLIPRAGNRVRFTLAGSPGAYEIRLKAKWCEQLNCGVGESAQKALNAMPVKKRAKCFQAYPCAELGRMP